MVQSSNGNKTAVRAWLLLVHSMLLYELSKSLHVLLRPGVGLQVKTDRPPWYLSVICGALLRVIQQVNLRSADYLGFLEKGQLPPAKLTLTSFEQQLVLEGML